jgi:proteasome accessory factor B
MKKAERVLDLIAFLLNANHPVTFEEIQNAFPDDYTEGAEEAIARKFERDKADIFELGLPLRYKDQDDLEVGGYIIDRDKYAMPELSLAPEELAMLFMVGTAVLDMDSSPFSRDLVLALNKIGFAADTRNQAEYSGLRALPNSRLEGVGALRKKEYLENLHRAITSKKTVVLFYHSLWRDEKTQRKVDPYGLVCQRGTWFLVGHCHLRDAIRVFNIDRITGLEVNRFKPKSSDFEFPADLKLSDYVAKHLWNIKAHDPVEVVIRFEPPVAETIAAELGASVEKIESDDEARIVHLKVTYLDGLLPTVLWYRDKSRVLAPPEMIEKTKTALQQIAADHSAPGES